MAGGSWVSALFLVLGLVIVNPAPSAAPGSVRGGGNAVPLARSSSPSQGGASGGQRLFACGARVALGAVARDAEDYETVAENLPGERDQQQAVGVGGGAHMAFVVPCSTAPGYPLRGIRGCTSQRMPTAPGAFAASDGGFFQSANGHLEAPPTDWSRASVVQSEAASGAASGAGTGVVGGSESRGNKMASGGLNSTSAVFAPLVNHLGMLQKVGGGGAEPPSMEELVRRIRVGGQEASRQAGPCHVPRLSPSKFTGGRSFSEAQHVSPGVTVVERLRGLSGRFELAKAMYLEEETDGEAREGQEVRRGRNREVRASRRPTFDGARTGMSGMAGGHVAASACGHSVVAFDRRRGSEQQEEEEEEKREREKSVGHGRGVWHAERAEDAPLVKPTSDEWLQDGDASHRRLIPCVVSVLESMSLASSSGGGSSSSRGRSRSRSRSGSGSGSGTARPKSSFHALRKPKVSLMDYVGRIAKYAACSSGCFVAAVVYMDRVLQRDGAHIEWENVHRLLLSCMLVAAKISDDVHYSNAFWAKIGGVANSELNELEMKVMSSLGWSAHISKREFDVYANGLASLRGEGMSSGGARIKGRKILAAIQGMEEAASLEGRVAVHLPVSFPNDGDAEYVQGDDEARKDAGMYRDSAGVAAHDASPDSQLSVAA